MRYSDRSRTELDWTCRRARFWGYEYQGRGLAPMQKPKELLFGGQMAEQIQNIKLQKPWTTASFAGEEKLLADALLTGYELVVWPRWTRDYDLVSTEQECPLLLNDWLTYNSRPDTITRRKKDQTLWYGPEDKTTAWIDSLLGYANNVQLHATAFCIEANGVGDVSGCLVQGLYKGFEKEGKLFHNLVYAYIKEGIPGIMPDQWSVKWGRGWERVPTTQYPDGIKAWIMRLTKSGELDAIFPNSQPVMINRVLAKKYLHQLELREQEIEAWRQRGMSSEELDQVFPQNFGQCDQFSKGRKPCSFKEACFNPTAQKFPLSFYQWREPHHANELEALK